MKKILDNEKIGIKEQMENEINRINESRKKLEGILEDLDKRIFEEEKYSNKESVGFNIEDIEKNAKNENKDELIRKKKMIEKALKQDNYCDLEFCKAAQKYIKTIRETIRTYEEEIEVNNKNVEKAREYLEAMKEKQEKENYDIKIMIEELINPLGESVFGEYVDKSGIAILNKVERKINSIINQKA